MIDENPQDEAPPSTLPRTLWVLRFATALHKQRPQLSAEQTMSIALEEFKRERDRQPERAAHLCALERFKTDGAG